MKAEEADSNISGRIIGVFSSHWEPQESASNIRDWISRGRNRAMELASGSGGKLGKETKPFFFVQVLLSGPLPEGAVYS